MAKGDPGLPKKLLTTVGGIILILLGIVGLFLPILQGILLIVAGLGVLSIGNERLRKWLARMKKRLLHRETRSEGLKNRISPQKKAFHSYGNSGLEEGANNER